MIISFLKKLFFGEEKEEKQKRIFVSFSMEDEKYRDHLIEQAKSKKAPFYFIDMSVKKPWKESWSDCIVE